MLALQPDEDAAQAALDAFDMRRLRRGRAASRLFLTLLTVFVIAGAANLLGGRRSTVAAEGAGYGIAVNYAPVARLGRDFNWSVVIRHEGGFQEPVRIATDSAYLHLAYLTALRPDPSTSTTQGTRTIWEFEPPEGDTLHVTLEGTFGQESMGIHPASTAILGPGGDVLEVDYRTTVLP